MSGFALVAILHLLNPAAFAARSQLDRAATTVQEGPGVATQLDSRYLASLGSDAVPILVERIEELPEADRGVVAERLLSRWGPDLRWDWRTWNLADWRARQVVEENAHRLGAMAGR